jgi:glycosyltransferase involved in cell wall biosynthesis
MDKRNSALVYDLIIFDDHVPKPYSSFRIAEFNYLLGEIPNSIILSSAQTFFFEKTCSVAVKYLPFFEKIFRELFSVLDFKFVAHEHCRDYPDNKGRVLHVDTKCKMKSRMAYMVFINNAVKFVDYLERNGIDFTFTLYPGGGFRLNDMACDKKLSRVFSSKNFKAVIVTQSIIKNYIVENNFCDERQVVTIYGGVLPSDYFSNIGNKIPYPTEKQTIDICFVANKYTSCGLDKGYDLFIATAHLLTDSFTMVNFHVVGDFNKDDVDVSALEGRITFYGQQPSSFFKRFYLRMDVILSPNRPFILAPGAFDGFPTGCCVEAGLCGVAVFCTDPLDLNLKFINHTDIVIIPDDISAIVSIVSDYISDLDKLYSLSRRIQSKFREVFDIHCQMEQRVNLIKNCNVSDEAVPANVTRSR